MAPPPPTARVRGLLVGSGSLVALLALFLVAGCGGGGSSATPSLGAHGAAPSSGAQGSSLTRVVLKIPAGRKTASKRSPAYVSAASEGVEISTYPALATPPSSGTAYDISQTGAGTLCSTTPPGHATPDPSGARYCTLPITAAVGVDAITAVVYDQAPTGGSGGVGGTINTGTANVLSRGTVQQTIVPFTTNAIDLTLNGTIASLQMTPSTIAVTTGQSYTLTVNALDADGYTIIAPGYYSSATQDQESIELEVCNAPSGAVSLSTTEITAPGQTVTVTINADVNNATPSPGPTGTPVVPASIMASVPDDGSVAQVQTNLTQGGVVVSLPSASPLAYNLGAFAVADGGDHLDVYAAGSNVGTPTELTSVHTSTLGVSLAAVRQHDLRGERELADDQRDLAELGGGNLEGYVSHFSCSCVTPKSIAVDSSGQTYVADWGSNAIDVFPANAANNPPTPAPYVLSGANTQLASPVTVALDANNYLYVLNLNGNSGVLGGQAYVTVYAPGARGNTAPIAGPVAAGLNTFAGSMAISPSGTVVLAAGIASGPDANQYEWLTVPVYPNFTSANATTLAPPNQYFFSQQQMAFDAYGNLMYSLWSGGSLVAFDPTLKVNFANVTVSAQYTSAVTSFTIPAVPQSVNRRPSSVGSHN